MFSKGKHTGRELVRRLRSENRHLDRQLLLTHARLRKANELLKAQTVQREVADGLVLRQVVALQEKNERIAQLERELAERTVETPIPTAAELAAA